MTERDGGAGQAGMGKEMSGKKLTVSGRGAMGSFQPKFLVSDFFFLSDNRTIAEQGCLTSITPRGFTFQSHKKNLTMMEENLLRTVLRQPIGFFLSEFEIELHGKVKGLYFLDNNLVEVSIGFLDDTPHFFRQCVTELLC